MRNEVGLQGGSLRQAGLTVRHVAQLLGVTPSRVSQIEKRAALANSA
jgi:predicted transcriptional regulator